MPQKSNNTMTLPELCVEILQNCISIRARRFVAGACQRVTSAFPLLAICAVFPKRNVMFKFVDWSMDFCSGTSDVTQRLHLSIHTWSS